MPSHGMVSCMDEYPTTQLEFKIYERKCSHREPAQVARLPAATSLLLIVGGSGSSTGTDGGGCLHGRSMASAADDSNGDWSIVKSVRDSTSDLKTWGR